ncbi:MAG: SgcJ/EcaC family oxidoreductase [Bryobacterales bacterium]
MRMMVLLLVSVLVGGLAPGWLAAQSASPADQEAIREIVQKYLDSREQRDPKSLATLFTDDVDQLVSSGVWRRGREALVSGTLASSESNAGKRVLTVETVRLIAADVAIADARYEIVGAAGAATRKMWSTFVMKRGDAGWQIAAIRNMLPAGS